MATRPRKPIAAPAVGRDIDVVVGNPPYMGREAVTSGKAQARAQGQDSDVFSSAAQLARIRDVLQFYHRLPFSGGKIPGAVMEGTLALVRDGRILPTYDFIDVIQDDQRVGWQVKSTGEDTPLTWKRAKIDNREDMIAASEKGNEDSKKAGLEALGRAIIDFCNAAVEASFEAYGIDAIGYARLIVHGDTATYFERELVHRGGPPLFKHDDYRWAWSAQRVGGKKSQLSALHGSVLRGDEWVKSFSWHGRGENQLHFSGEREWWPEEGEAKNMIRFPLPQNRIELDALMEMLAKDAPPKRG